MPTKDRKFTLKDYEQLIDDVLQPYFQEQNVTHDLEELKKAQGDSGQEAPPGYHFMPDGTLMLNSEMEKQEVV